MASAVAAAAAARAREAARPGARAGTLCTLALLLALRGAAADAGAPYGVEFERPLADELVSNDLDLGVAVRWRAEGAAGPPGGGREVAVRVAASCGGRAAGGETHRFHRTDASGGLVRAEVRGERLWACRGDRAWLEATLEVDGVVRAEARRTVRVQTRTLSAIYTACSALSAGLSLLVLALYAAFPALRAWPSTLVAWRTACNLLFAGLLLYLSAWDLAGDINETSCNMLVAAATQFALLGSLNWYLATAVNFHLSVRNPFVRPASRLPLFHAWAWTTALGTAAASASMSGYRADFQLCWIRKRHDVLNINFFNWLFYFLWVLAYSVYALYALLYGSRKLRVGSVQETLQTRLRGLREGRTYLVAFLVYWVVAGSIWSAVFLTSGDQRLVQQPWLAFSFAVVIGGMGVVDAVLWLLMQWPRIAAALAASRAASRKRKRRLRDGGDGNSESHATISRGGAVHADGAECVTPGAHSAHFLSPSDGESGRRFSDATAASGGRSRDGSLGDAPPGSPGDVLLRVTPAGGGVPDYGAVSAAGTACETEDTEAAGAAGGAGGVDDGDAREFEDISQALRYDFILRTTEGIVTDALRQRRLQRAASGHVQSLVTGGGGGGDDDAKSSSSDGDSDAGGGGAAFQRHRRTTSKFLLRRARSTGDADEAAEIAADVLGSPAWLSFSPARPGTAASVSERNTYDLEGGGGVQFRSYAPGVFHSLRLLHGVSEEEYARSVDGDVRRMAQHFSEGASGSFFYLTTDKRYMVKTLEPREQRTLLRMLAGYHEHLRRNPGTLLCRFFGLYSITLFSHKQYFVVMQNALSVPEGYEIAEVYDLKGSSLDRHAPPPPKGGGRAARRRRRRRTLKDNDLHSTVNIASGAARAIVAQVRRDAHFLRDNNVMDYSMLLGIHKCTERRHQKVHCNGLGEGRGHYPFPGDGGVRQRRRGGGGDGGGGDGGGAAAAAAAALPLSEGRVAASRLVGPGVYHMAMVDILCEWDWRKRLEQSIKTFFLCRLRTWRRMSAVEPVYYADRFVRMTRRLFRSRGASRWQ